MKVLIVTIIIIVLVIFTGIYYFQEKLIFFPQKLPPEFRFTFKQSFDERFFEPAEDVRIHALHFKVEDSHGLIYYLHGNAGNLHGWGTVAEDFTDQNYDVLMIDYRGYGKSRGRISESGLLHDVLFIYDAIKDEYAEKNIVVYGRSIGTGMASFVASRRSPGLLILESPYYNLPDAARSYFPWFPSFLIRFRFRNDQYLQKTGCPVYIFHGDRDEVLNVKGSYKLQPLLKSQDSLIIVKGGHHNDLVLFDEYRQNLQRILLQFAGVK
jgi:uncharacterized protein